MNLHSVEVTADLLEAFALLPCLNSLELYNFEMHDRLDVHVLLPCLRSVKTTNVLLWTLDAPNLRFVRALVTPSNSIHLQRMIRFLERHEQLEEVRLQLSLKDTLSDLGSSFEALFSRVRVSVLAVERSIRWDTGAAAIARASPALETLDLYCAISWETFALILTCCPLLQHFEVTIDFFLPLPPLPSWSDPGHNRVHALSELRMVVDPRDDITEDFDVDPIALFLQDICPRVQCTPEPLRLALQTLTRGSQTYLHWTRSSCP